MFLDSESNLGPIIGILFTGPAGAVTGAVLGALSARLPLSANGRGRILLAACILLAAGTLFYSLPKPAIRGYVIDARVESCEPPAQALDAAMKQWDEAVARVTWATPSAQWKSRAVDNVQHDSGVVLTMSVRRKKAILRHRRPWDRDNTSAGPWIDVDESKRYYASDEGSECPSYIARNYQLDGPAVDADAAYAKPAPIWPPIDTLGFLQLQTLEAVPEHYQRLLD
jgi:hypothetical protein